jgi:mono/diheme cytochrome c family protein
MSPLNRPDPHRGKLSLATVTLAVCCFATSAALAVDPQSRSRPIDFARDIRSVLSENCFHCHGPDAKNRQADLRLDTADGVNSKLVAGKRGESELFRRLLSTDPEEVMPPPDSNRKLTPDQIERVGSWIDDGAKWQGHWAFEPLVKPSLPPISDTADTPATDEAADKTTVGPIDRIVRKVWQEEAIEPSPAASPEARLRRVTLDLTGLPPTPEELDAFLADPSPAGYARVVERLLQSPAYGERMAWDWLDAARYADSNGYQGDGERTMWPWRDWVVGAFDRNVPFNDFTLWQVAGDLIPDATHEQKLASGFFRNHMINGEGGRIAEENRIEYVFDMTETLGTVWLGLTLNCCRCHDHKFDPLTQQDYYKLFAIFNQTPVNGGGGNPQTPPILDVPDAAQAAEIERLENILAERRANLASRVKELESKRDDWQRETLTKLEASPPWRPMTPVSFTAQRQSLRLLDDASLLAGGDNPAQDVYRIVYQPTSPRATGILIEALRHESMTTGGLARSDSGNFVLTDVDVEVISPGAPPKAVRIVSAEATFEQGDFKIAKAFDDDPASGWAVLDGKPIDRDHAAVLRFEAPIDTPPGSALVVTLRHQSPHVSHNIGRLRISTTDNDRPVLDASSQRALLAALQKPAEARTDDERKLIVKSQLESDAPHQELSGLVTTAEKELAGVRGAVPKVMVMGDQPEPRKTFVLQVGAYNKPGEEVSGGVPGFLPGLPDGAAPNRLGVAKWLIDDRNPLMPRVVVNRFWQMFFGVGLVKTPEDFGSQGEIPRQRELLDWLAADFRESGWDVKGLVRKIVTSDVYQQSSKVTPQSHERDPDNRLLARGPRRRMPSWMIRDQALAIGGLLVPKVGGRPVNTYQPPGIWEEATFGFKKYQQDQGEALYRRTLYTFWRRIVAPTMLFDNASRQSCTVSPFLTNTPLHALTTLNDVTYVEAARAMSQRVLAHRDALGQADAAAADRESIRYAFRLATARYPADAEANILDGRLKLLRGEFAADIEGAKRLLKVGESPAASDREPAEQAAWAALCSLILNLDETITKP